MEIIIPRPIEVTLSIKAEMTIVIRQQEAPVDQATAIEATVGTPQPDPDLQLK